MESSEAGLTGCLPMAFGPVPSRRLGRSVGINHIPPKTCSYACVYCQLGRTSRLRTVPGPLFGVDDIVAAVERQVDQARTAGEPIDYLTLVPDGEPTLDANLGRLIERLKPLGIRIAVISNGSLLWRADVRGALDGADWVSVKVDAVRPDIWQRVNRPHGRLLLSLVLEGMLTFERGYRGTLASETMLVRGVNDDVAHLEAVARFLAQLQPTTAYLAVPTRPPAEAWVEPPSEETVNQAFQLLRSRLERVELLIGYEGDAFASAGDPAEDLLSITAVHPMREDAVQRLLASRGADMAVVRTLLAAGQLVETTYGGHKFYSRKLKGVSAYGKAEH